MTNQTPIAATIAEALSSSISLIASVGPETPVGLALATIKLCLQRNEQELHADRNHWLSVTAALRRTQGGSP